MIKVNLKQNWQAPNGRLYRKNENPVEIPAELADVIPEGAVVVEDSRPQKKTAPKPKAEEKPKPKAEEKPKPKADSVKKVLGEE